MPENDKFFSVNIREYLALGNDEEAGEPALVESLSGFSCPKNLRSGKRRKVVIILL